MGIIISSYFMLHVTDHYGRFKIPPGIINPRIFREPGNFGINGVVLAYGILPTCHLRWLPLHMNFVRHLLHVWLCIFLGSGDPAKAKSSYNFPLLAGKTKHIAGVTQLQLTHKWGFPKIVVLQYGWFIMENPIQMDDLGGKPTILRKHPNSQNTQSLLLQSSFHPQHCSPQGILFVQVTTVLTGPTTVLPMVLASKWLHP